MLENRRNNLIKFVYSPTGHIVTGDVELVKHFANDKVAELCRKGYKYRIGNNKVTWGRILNDIINVINQLKTKLANKVRCEVNMLDQWAKSLIKIIKNKIFALKSEFNLSDFVNYDMQELKNDLENLHKHFVITTVDKANNNYCFICKKFYLATIKKELGVSGNPLRKNVQGNSVYEIQNNLNIDHLINDHTIKNADFDVTLSDRNKCVPNLYMIPKFHKRPYKYRFIAGAKFATTKLLSVQVVQCLKYIKNTHKRYCNTIYKRLGINYFWSVDNSLEVVQKINTVDKMKSVHSYDFSTLYTNLPLNLVYSELCYIIELHFDRFAKNGNYFLNINSYFDSATQSSTPKGKVSFSLDKLKKSIKFLLFNTYIKFGPYIFKQILGIPMGGNASPLIADLFLLSLEFKFMRNLVDSKNPAQLDLAKTLSNNCRFIDDILVCNYSNFIEIAKLIYPNSIPLTQSNTNDNLENFLDLNITLENEQCILKIYHKVDDYDFNVISFPFPCSNININITYNCFYSQLVRFSYICTKLVDFKYRSVLLFKLLVNRGFDRRKLLHKFNQFRVHYCDRLIKFDLCNINRDFLS